MSRLVLTRKLNQSVILHKDGEVLADVKITKIERNQVRITFTADTDVSIDREEKFNTDQKR